MKRGISSGAVALCGMSTSSLQKKALPSYQGSVFCLLHKKVSSGRTKHALMFRNLLRASFRQLSLRALFCVHLRMWLCVSPDGLGQREA